MLFSSLYLVFIKRGLLFEGMLPFKDKANVLRNSEFNLNPSENIPFYTKGLSLPINFYAFFDISNEIF